MKTTEEVMRFLAGDPELTLGERINRLEVLVIEQSLENLQPECVALEELKSHITEEVWSATVVEDQLAEMLDVRFGEIIERCDSIQDGLKNLWKQLENLERGVIEGIIHVKSKPSLEELGRERERRLKVAICPKCGGEFSPQGIGLHKKACDGGVRKKPIDYLPEIVNKLKLKEETEKKAEELLNELISQGSLGIRPESLACGAVYIAGMICNDRVTQSQISRDVGIVEPTTRKAYRKILEVAGIDHTDPEDITRQVMKKWG